MSLGANLHRAPPKKTGGVVAHCGAVTYGMVKEAIMAQEGISAGKCCMVSLVGYRRLASRKWLDPK